MKFSPLSIDGAKADTIEISDKLVKLKVNHKLIKFVIDWQLNHAKPRTAKTKDTGGNNPLATFMSIFPLCCSRINSLLVGASLGLNVANRTT